MDAADLDYRVRTLSGCIPPLLVSRLLELGHAAEVEFQAGRGEWFCAREWARLLGGQGRQTEALEVLAPYAATGWWPAARAEAELLEGWGRVEEAIERAWPYAQAGDRLALEFFARLLARHDRGVEAFTLLRAGIDDWFLADCLVDIAEGAGLDEEAAALLEGRVEAVPACGDPDCDNRQTEPSNAVGLLAAIRERQGRVEDAIALLHTRTTTSVNGRDQLADLLARHDRIEELRAYAATEYHGHAARRLAEVLEEHGDVEGAIDVYRQPGDSPARRCHGAVFLSELLTRHGRSDEAIDVMRALAESPGGGEDWIVNALCTLYADHGRAHDGLAYLDALKARHDGEEEWDFFRMRLRLMADCGLLDEAIEQARAHPEGDTWYAAWSVSDLLAEAGRTEEAVAVLEQHLPFNSSLLARHLIDLGRIKDAVGVLQEPRTKPAEPVWTGTFSPEPPF
ncbi:tetratricopeptide repeat protein [Streptomyces puniciscabiei]